MNRLRRNAIAPNLARPFHRDERDLDPELALDLVRALVHAPEDPPLNAAMVEGVTAHCRPRAGIQCLPTSHEEVQVQTEVMEEVEEVRVLDLDPEEVPLVEVQVPMKAIRVSDPKPSNLRRWNNDWIRPTKAIK